MLTDDNVTRDDLGDFDSDPSPVSFARDRYVLFMVTVVVFGIVGGYVGYLRGLSFVADSLILLRQSQPTTVYGSLTPAETGDPEVFLNDQVAIITSTSLAQDVAAALGSTPDLETAEALISRLTVTPNENSRAIELEFVAEDEETAVATVNEFVRQYEMVASEALNGPYDTAIGAVDAAIVELQMTIDEVEEQVNETVQQSTGPLRARTGTAIARIDEITEAIPSATAEERLSLVAEADALASSITALQTTIASLEAQPGLVSQRNRLEVLNQRSTSLANRRAELEVDRNTAVSPIVARSEAIVAESPGPSFEVSVTVGLVLGAVLALATAYLASGMGKHSTARRRAKY